MNLLDTIGLFGAVVLAAPIGLLGVEFLVHGRTLVGFGFLSVALALVAGTYLKPSLSGIVAGTVLDKTPVDESHPDPDRDDEAYKD